MGINAKSVIKRFNLRPVKSLGQNFLTDNNILMRIAESAELSKDDLVLEIGPGLGSLTAVLAEAAGLVAAVEIDRKLIPVLEENLKQYSNVRIIQGDILKLNIKEELAVFANERSGDFAPSVLKIVANLPYYITTPVVMMLLESGIKANLMVFMVQKEVEGRMMARPGEKEYGALSVAVQYYSRPSTVMKVPPCSFVPQPDVDSAVVKLNIYGKPPVELRDRGLFFRVVKAAFGQRRKTLLNALRNSGYFNLDKTQIQEILGKTGIGENQRGETLSVEEFGRLSNEIFDYCSLNRRKAYLSER